MTIDNETIAQALRRSNGNVTAAAIEILAAAPKRGKEPASDDEKQQPASRRMRPGTAADIRDLASDEGFVAGMLADGDEHPVYEGLSADDITGILGAMGNDPAVWGGAGDPPISGLLDEAAKDPLMELLLYLPPEDLKTFAGKSRVVYTKTLDKDFRYLYRRWWYVDINIVPNDDVPYDISYAAVTMLRTRTAYDLARKVSSEPLRVAFTFNGSPITDESVLGSIGGARWRAHGHADSWRPARARRECSADTLEGRRHVYPGTWSLVR